MKKILIRHSIKLLIVAVVSNIALDYINFPSLLGFEMSNINYSFCMELLNISVVVVLYIITYKILDKRTIEHENNKSEVSIFLIKECYKECWRIMELLNQETVEKYIVPKIDFNSTNSLIIKNLQNDPFSNENIIMDFVKDGQLSEMQISGYFKVKKEFREYINMRIIAYDAPHIYEPLRTSLCSVLDEEIRCDRQK